VIHKLQLGMGETGHRAGLRKDARMPKARWTASDRQVLGYFSTPASRGQVFVFPHIFAEVMRDYMAPWNVSERDLAAIPVQEYANANLQSCAAMNKVQITLDQRSRSRDSIGTSWKACRSDLRLFPDHRWLRGPDPPLPKKASRNSACRNPNASKSRDGERRPTRSGRRAAKCCGRPARIARCRLRTRWRSRAGGCQRRGSPRLFQRDGSDRYGSDREDRGRQGRPILGGRQGGSDGECGIILQAA